MDAAMKLNEERKNVT